MDKKDLAINMFLSGNIRCCSIGIAAGITVLFFLLTGSAGAVPGEEWNRTYAGGGNTSATDIWQTSDGGYIFAGAACYNQWCMPWLVRTDAHGNEQWNRTFMDVYPAKSVLQTMDGGYILAGRKLIKTDLNGNEEWNMTYNGTFNSVQQTSDGGYVGAGAIDTGMGGIIILMAGSLRQMRTAMSNGTGRSKDMASAISIQSSIPVMGDLYLQVTEIGQLLIVRAARGSSKWMQMEENSGTGLSGSGTRLLEVVVKRRIRFCRQKTEAIYWQDSVSC